MEFDLDDIEETKEDNINTCLQNTLKDKFSTPRYPVYLGLDILKVYLSGADWIEFDVRRNTVSINFKTTPKINTSLIDKSLLIQIADRIKNPMRGFSQDEALKRVYRIAKIEKPLTDKQHQEILKYEQRKRGSW